MNKDKNIVERQSNIELLRVIAILMVIIYHLGYHTLRVQLGGGFSSVGANVNSFQFKLLILETTQTFGQIGNDIFILITGFFIAGRERINISKAAKKLLLQVGFVTILITILSFLYYKFVSPTFTGLVGIDIFNSGWWFAGYYIGILAVAFFLNPVLQKISRNEHLSLILVLFSVVSIGFLGEMMDDWMMDFRRFITGIMIYCLGGYIKKYDPFKKVKSCILVLLIALVFAFLWLSYYNTSINTINQSKIEGITLQQNVDVFKVYSIVPLLISIMIFELFRRIKIKSNQLINSFAASSFMVYILHDNTFMRAVANEYDLISFFNEHTLACVAFWFGCSVALFIIGFLIHLVYSKLLSFIIK